MTRRSRRLGRGSTPVRLLLEGTMIVFSVLAALALDAAVSERTERRQELEYLGLLRDEFEQSRAEVLSDRQEREAIVERTNWLLAWAEDAPPEGVPAPLPIDSLARWVGDLTDFRYYTPVQVVTEDLLSSGSFGLLESDEVRRLILALRLEEDRITVVDERERDFVATHIEPVLARRLPLEQIEMGTGDPDEIRTAIRALFREPEMRNLTLMRLNRTDTAYRFSGGLSRILQSLVEQLEAEMAGR